MGVRDAILVPGAIRFAQEVLIGSPLSAFNNVWSFQTFADANAYLDTLGGSGPADDKRFLYRFFPGRYSENLWIPDYVSSLGEGDFFDQLIQGDGTTGKALVSVGVGSLGNCGMTAALVGGTPAVGAWLRNSSSVYTAHEDDYGSLTGTLKITPDGKAQETFTFGGEESGAQDVADLINATAVELTAIVKFGRVEIRPNLVTSGITVDSTGTVNAALGFSTTLDTSNPSSVLEHRKIERCIFVGPYSEAGVLVDDLSGQNFLTHINAALTPIGVKVADGVQLSLVSPQLAFNIGPGLSVGDTAVVSSDAGYILDNAVNDVVLGVAAEFKPRSTAYKNLSKDINSVLTPEVKAEAIKLDDNAILFGIGLQDVEEGIFRLADSRETQLPANSWFALAGGPTKGILGDAEVWFFEGAGIDRSLYRQLRLPKFDVGSGIDLKLILTFAHTTAPNAPDKTIQWFIDTGYVGGGENVVAPSASESFDEVHNIGQTSNANRKTVDLEVSLNKSLISMGDTILIKLTRSPGDVDDIYTGAMAFMGGVLSYGA